MRRLLPLLLFALSAWANPLFPGFGPPPLFAPQGGIVTIDLGGGLFWQGPELTQEEWDQLMAGLPGPAPVFPSDDTVVGPIELPMHVAPPPVVNTPEPSTLSMLSLGLLAAGLLLRSRR